MFGDGETMLRLLRQEKKYRSYYVAKQQVKWRTNGILLPNLKRCDMQFGMFNTYKNRSHRDRLDTSKFKKSKREIHDQDKYDQALVQRKSFKES